MSERPYLPALSLAELAPGTMRCVTLADEPVLVVGHVINDGAEYFGPLAGRRDAWRHGYALVFAEAGLRHSGRR